MHSLLFSVLIAALAARSFALHIIGEMSFGYDGRISPNTFNIPGWTMQGEGHVPQIFSNKVVLTPPYGANKRGALWSEKPGKLQDWQMDLEFRVGITERGNGNLQFWYVKDGATTVGTKGIYQVGKFDGLGLIIDTNGGVQKIRGFLNDGNTDYSTHANVDGLAFGHCDYTYRNQAGPSQLQVRSSATGLEVRIDGNPCFSTSKVTLPTEYSFGVTAVSGDPPDSFEVFKIALLTADPKDQNAYSQERQTIVPPQQQQQQQQHQQSSPPLPQQPQQIRNPPTTQYQNQNPSTPPVIDNDYHPASYYTTSDSQFADLHNRLNLLSKSITNLFAEITKHTKSEEQRYQEILRAIPNPASLSSLESRIAKLDRQISNLEQELKTSSSDHSGNFARISEQLEKTHQGVTEHMPQRLREYMIAHTPRIGFILYSFMAFQTCCIGAFVWYKWRKNHMPKKYL